MSLEGGLNGVSAPPVEGSVSVTATDPKDSLAAPHAGSALALDLSSPVTGTGLAHHDWPDQKPGRPDAGSCLITVLPHGDPIQAGADLMHPNDWRTP
ncbi:hypothetical protein LAUMK4_03022 [Mycobacterium persicum]|uniref:Uncharacterized protein n=2 Tax=Mycobacterium TaxID=1763 RepID=A0A1V3XDX9_MYCKA|nr:hypothetical protein I547_4985 [Mycobacterium kansasii 824]OOK77425.1 hypothetical protein BZL29_2950 [Mycobacterium kansasii]BCI87831.1 hypothetical protein NIIDMKKI_30370 [Mycobacterium kansasii]VAZ95091.1 hypothetical protein LAUMK4_03022 [Mycobacterium persicum]